MEQTVRQQLSDYIVAHQEEFYRLAYSYVKNRDAALDVVRLRFFEDMKLEEIARVTNTNLNTVKSRLYKSLRRLRELTEEEC